MRSDRLPSGDGVGGVTPGAGCHCRYGTGVWALASVSGVS